MSSSDWIALTALMVSIGSPIVQFAYHRIQLNRRRLEVRVGTVGPGQVEVTCFLTVDEAAQALFATVTSVYPPETRLHFYRGGFVNSYTGENVKSRYNREADALPHRAQMLSVEGGAPRRFMFGFVYHGHGTLNPVTLHFSIQNRSGQNFGRYKRTLFPPDYVLDGPSA